MRLLADHLLVERVPTKQVGSIHLPPSALDDYNNAQVKMYKLVAKGPKPFEAEPGDNLIVWPITCGPEDVGGGRFILRKPKESVLAVIPRQPIVSTQSAS